MLDIVDTDAVTISLAFSRSQTASSAMRVFHLGETGAQLLKKKESLPSGQWLSWLHAHRHVLGFSVARARSLISGAQWMSANLKLADRLEEIVTDPEPSQHDLDLADDIRQLIAAQFASGRGSARGTLGRRLRYEWYTPAKYVAMVKRVLGEIDVDPASSAVAQETVKAKTYFDKDVNGLKQSWDGKVFLNPPYAPPLINKFVAKFLQEWNAGRTTEAIALTHNYTSSAWFGDVISAADMVCFPQGRIAFYEPDGEIARPTQGQAFFYFGRGIDAFANEFSRIGFLVRPQADSWTRQKVLR